MEASVTATNTSDTPNWPMCMWLIDEVQVSSCYFLVYVGGGGGGAANERDTHLHSIRVGGPRVHMDYCHLHGYVVYCVNNSTLYNVSCEECLWIIPLIFCRLDLFTTVDTFSKVYIHIGICFEMCSGMYVWICSNLHHFQKENEWITKHRQAYEGLFNSSEHCQYSPRRQWCQSETLHNLGQPGASIQT